jgi:hypothetical protein
MESSMEAEGIDGSWIKQALVFYDGLEKANKGFTNILEPINVPLELLDDEEIGETPRMYFTEEEWAGLDDWMQTEIHINDEDSRRRISEMSHALINRLDWIAESYHDDDNDFFSEGIKYASKQPDFLDTVPDEDNYIDDLMSTYASILGEDRVKRALLYYLDDADYYDREHEDSCYPSRAGYFQIGIQRDFYISDSTDIESLDDAFTDEIKAALDRAEEERPYVLEETGLTLEILLDIKAGSSDFQAELECTESWAYTPQWESIVESIQEELNDELPDEPLKSDDKRSYEKRKAYTFEDGAYWVELTTEELPTEGQRLGHCIGDLEHGYPQSVAEGSHRVYSLRTPSGRSKLTIAVGPTGHVKDLRGKGNRIAGWGGKVGEGKVKWMEVQKVGKLLEILHAPWPPQMRETLEAVKEAVGGPVFTQNPHCAFCLSPGG